MTALFNINFHDLISISGRDLPENLRNKILANTGQFVSHDPEHQAKSFDIVLSPMVCAPQLNDFLRHMNHIYGFCLVDFQGRNAVCFLRRARPELCLFFSSGATLEIAYQPDTKAADLFWAILLFACHLAARLKNMLMCHGSVVVKNGRAIVFSGHQGVGKTPVLLHFLKKGWDYLSDDKFFLSSGRVYLMQTHIAVNQYHFQVLPWLSDHIPVQTRSILPRAVQQNLNRLATRIWPGGVPVRVYCYLHPGQRIDLEKRPFNSSIISRAAPVLWVMLQGTGTHAMSHLDPKTGVDKLALIQQMFFSHRSDLENCLLFSSDQYPVQLREILAHNLPEDLGFAMATVPENRYLDRFYEKILDHCP